MTVKKSRQRYLLELAFIIGMPVIILFAGIALLKIREPEFLPKEKIPEKKESSTDLTPATIFDSPLAYQDKTVTVHGRIDRINPECSKEGNLILKEPNKNLLKDDVSIKMYGPEKSALCKKISESCDYDCGVYEIGGEYEITGKIIVVRPLGMTLGRGYLEYYMLAESANKLAKAQTQEYEVSYMENLMQKLGTIFSPKGF